VPSPDWSFDCYWQVLVPMKAAAAVEEEEVQIDY
jgi:hypothetical protein